MLKSLSVVVTDESRDRPALTAAVNLARREDSHLNVICLGVMPIEIVTLEMGALVSEPDRIEVRGQAEALAAWARAQMPADVDAALTTAAIPSFDLLEGLAPLARTSRWRSDPMERVMPASRPT